MEIIGTDANCVEYPTRRDTRLDFKLCHHASKTQYDNLHARKQPKESPSVASDAQYVSLHAWYFARQTHSGICYLSHQPGLADYTP